MALLSHSRSAKGERCALAESATHKQASADLHVFQACTVRPRWSAEFARRIKIAGHAGDRSPLSHAFIFENRTARCVSQ
jgi:hypothetical protein